MILKSALDRVYWYYSRLTAMSMPEIVFRIVNETAKQLARRKNCGWQAVKPSGCLAAMPQIASNVFEASAELRISLACEAEKVREGNFYFLGAHWPKSSVIPPDPEFWSIDPEDGERFPKWDVYTFDISFRHGVEIREIKHIWEINRLQFLVPLAADAALKDNQDSSLLVVELIKSWMDGNPPFRGPSWISGIELSLRIISVSLALSITTIERIDANSREMVLRFLFAHLDWLKQFPSRYSSANNHRIAELAGLIIGSTVAPGFPHAVEMRENSWRELLIEIDRQILPDGVGAEQSPGYAAFSIELFLLAAAALGYDRLPDSTVNRLSAWAEHSLWTMDANGVVPSIGGFDSGRVIATTQAPEVRYVASVVAAVSKCIERPDLAPPAKDASLRDVILGSANVQPAQIYGMRAFTNGGYSVIRSKYREPVVLIFDHGPLGYLSIAAHGHADTLSIWLSVGAYPVLVDAGTYLYHSKKRLREIFKETAIHNTLTLDGVGSSQPSGPFNWATKANARVIAAESNRTTRIIAEHDGYEAQYGVRHRRTVEYDGASQFMIIDELVGEHTSKSVSLSFLLDPACKAIIGSNQNEVSITHHEHGEIARMASVDRLNAKIARGDESGLGWISPSFGVRIPTDQILFEGYLSKSSTIIMTII